MSLVGLRHKYFLCLIEVKCELGGVNELVGFHFSEKYNYKTWQLTELKERWVISFLIISNLKLQLTLAAAVAAAAIVLAS